MSGRAWTPAADAALTAAWANSVDVTTFQQEMATQLGRTPRSIQERRLQLGLTTRENSPSWTAEEDQALAAGHPLGDAHLAEQLGRTLSAVYQRRTVLRNAGVECVRNGLPGSAARRAGGSAPRARRATTKPPRTTQPDTPNTPTHTGPLPPGWYGPPGSGHGPGETWVPGAAFRKQP